MRMKKNIRKAFDRAAPDALGQILQELPEQTTAMKPRPVRTMKKTSHFREFVATAAALALFISVVGGTAWYVGSGDHAAGTSPSAPTGNPSATWPDITDPIEPMPEVFVEDLDYLAEDILYPWQLRDTVYVEPEEKTQLWTVCTDSVYILKKIMGDYVYEFHFDSYDGKLLDLLVVDTTNNPDKGFIPETVAQAIALLKADLQQGGQTSIDHSQLVKTANSGYYCITVSSTQELSTAVYYVHAFSGKLLDLGEEVEPDYTVGPPPTEDTLPPDGLIPEDIAIQMALSYAGVTEYYDIQIHFDPSQPSYSISINDGKYLYSVTIHAYSGEILAFPTPEVPTPPDGNIGPELAGQTALDYLGFLMEKIENYSCTFVSSSEESDHYLITFDDETTHFVIKVGAYNPSILSCEKFQREGATTIMARNYALDYVGISIENVRYLQIGNTGDGGFLIHIVCDSIEYQFTLDYYGSVTSLQKNDAPLGKDETRTNLIGWRVARDIYMADKGMTLDSMTAFSYQFISEEGQEEYYDVNIDGNGATIVAKSGEYFYEGDGDGPVIYTKAILTVDEITDIVLNDLGAAFKDAYLAGAFGECQQDCRVYYAGVRDGAVLLQYQFFLAADETIYTYQLDAFTGEILHSQTVTIP